jgi:signal transduction histidine kinase/ligand-binding sensor domain-containing protein/DNA-binding response OmpR family regulator
MKLCYNILFFLLFHQFVWGQEGKSVLFSHLNTDNGLSGSSINCILKDKYGFLWFGTEDGLNKYDGYKFKVFRNKPNDSATIPYNNITSLFEDKAGELWIGTLGFGVAKYNRSNDSFTSYGGGAIYSVFEDADGTMWISTFHGLRVLDRKSGKIIPAGSKNNPLSAIENLVTHYVYEDSHRNLWIGTMEGIFLFDKKAGKLRNIKYHSKLLDPNKWLGPIQEDKNGFFWIPTGSGLYAFNYRNDTLVEQANDIKIPDQLKNNVINSICINKDRTIWVGRQSELILFNPINGTYNSFKKDPHDDQSLSHNFIRTLYLDDQDILWVGTFGGGINKYDKNQLAISRYRIFSSISPDLVSNIVTSFEEDLSGNVWIGTDGGGLFTWRAADKQFIPFYPGSKENYLPSYYVRTLKLSRNKDILWTGTNDQGLIELNIKTKSTSSFNTGNKKLNDNFVTSILEDRNDNLWVATDKGGISVLCKRKEKIEIYNILPNESVRTLFEDTDGSIWIGWYYGVKIYNPDTKNFTNLSPDNSNIGGTINCIFKDSENNIWVGTMERGLQLFDRKVRKFITFSEEQGLAGIMVNSIIEDAQGYLWIGTSRGISRFDREKHIFKNYTKEDGLQSNEFNKGAGHITKTGKIFFGSVDGFNVFDPEYKVRNSNIPAVVITDFQLSNKSLSAAMYNPHSASPQITLSYDQSVFSIEFAALNFTVPEKNQYAYMLEGFDKDWNYAGHEHKATYTNLDPGEYIFRVIASNNDGVWNKKGTSLKIIITPPFWKTNYAYIIYLLIAAVVLYYIYREIKARERLKNEMLFQKLSKEKMEELNQMKLNFFTNISHELRTPLSLIIDPLRKITGEEISASQLKNLGNLAFKNAARLSNLVNQLLDFRRFSGEYKLEAQHINLIEAIKEICQAFEERAREREIEFDLSFNTAFKDAWMDIDKLEKILTNLISNAFKFTPNGGKIQVLVSAIIEKNENVGEGFTPTLRSLEIRVKDTGPGIPQAYKQKIFDLFFQVEGTTRYDMESSGIGLSLAKELVLLHGGEISEEGKQGEGALFVVKMPLQENIYPSKEAEPARMETVKESFSNNSEDSSKSIGDNLSEGSIILVVEDNQELREYISGDVLSKYHVEQAVNGIEGFEKAVALIPDLIISDIMMPGGDGIELCEKLKTDERTSHIPVILLTAKQTDENKIEGYKTGADAYVSKPFNSALLNTQVENLLESRKRLRALFSKVKTMHSAEAAITNVDKEFLKKAEQAVLDNLSNTEFDVNTFAEKLKMNRRQLTRKLKAVTNQTPNEYITIVRFKKAVDLLIAGDLNISEVGYAVGFSEPTHFTRAFTRVYGKSPRKYVSDLSDGLKQS